MLLTMLLALIAAPETEKLFGNWAVNCDNVKRCEATALQTAGKDSDQYRETRLSREPGPAGAVTIELWPEARTGGIIDVLIDGKLMATGMLRGDSVRLTGATAEGVARAMASGRELSLRSGRQILARISLAGSSAMLRYIDAQQGRADGVTALVAKGKKSAATVPAAQPLPRITAIRPPKGTARPLDAATLKGLSDQGGCRAGDLKPAYHRLDARTVLAMVPCAAGPTNSQHRVFTVRDGKATPARFDRTPDGQDAAPVVAITNYAWSNGELVSSVKNNAGDCGASRIWVWDGERFRMTLTNELGACWRSGLWLTSYRADAVWK